MVLVGRIFQDWDKFEGEWVSDICAPLNLQNVEYEYVLATISFRDDKFSIAFLEYPNSTCDGARFEEIDLTSRYDVRTLFATHAGNFEIDLINPDGPVIEIEGRFFRGHIEIEGVYEQQALNAYIQASPLFERIDE